MAQTASITATARATSLRMIDPSRTAQSPPSANRRQDAPGAVEVASRRALDGIGLQEAEVVSMWYATLRLVHSRLRQAIVRAGSLPSDNRRHHVVRGEAMKTTFKFAVGSILLVAAGAAYT